MAQLVVPFNGRLGGLHIHAFQLGQQLLDGIGLEAGACGYRLFDRLGSTYAEGRPGIVLRELIRTEAEVHIAMARREAAALLRPFGIEELVRGALGLHLDLVLDLLAGRILVHEALAFEIQIQVSVDSHDALAGDVGASAHVVNHGSMMTLHPRACPSAHAMPIAAIGVIAFGISVDPHGGHTVLDRLRCKGLQHRGIGGIVARSQHNALRRIDFPIGTVFGLIDRKSVV